MGLPRFAWRWMHFAQLVYARNPKAPIGRVVLLLTTIGRKTGRPRVTPLQYEKVDGDLYVASVRGKRADWYKNIQACPRVSVQVGPDRFAAIAEMIEERSRIADFLQLRLDRHPVMVRLIMLMDGIGPRAGREELERYGERLALVTLKRVEEGKEP